MAGLLLVSIAPPTFFRRDLADSITKVALRRRMPRRELIAPARRGFPLVSEFFPGLVGMWARTAERIEDWIPLLRSLMGRVGFPRSLSFGQALHNP